MQSASGQTTIADDKKIRGGVIRASEMAGYREALINARSVPRELRVIRFFIIRKMELAATDF